MLDVLNLALPFFGLIFIGFACGKLRPIPHTGLAWMNFFIIYVALPSMFYRILARTPFEQVANIPFIVAVTASTVLAFVLAFVIAWAIRRRVPEATLAAAIGGYGNVGYMGPGIAVATLGPDSAVPVALIFCFDTAIILFLVPFILTLSGGAHAGVGVVLLQIARRVLLHPLIVATALGVTAAAIRFEPPSAIDTLLQFLQNAAAPCALFTLGVTVALRPLENIPWEVPPAVLVKLVIHPVLALLALSLFGPQPEVWVYTAVMLAALPPALNVFVLARQYDTWVAEASSAILVGTLVSVVTLTAVMWLVSAKRLPLSLW
jgi:malonate transporter and related proteins